MQSEIDALEVVRTLKSQAPWGIKLGVGSFLTMEFGKREEEQSGRVVHGEWHLWLYMCDWRIESNGKIITGSDDDRPVIEAALKGLPFGAVESVGLLDPTLDLSLQFTSRTKLLTFSSSSDREEDQWMLFTPNGHCLKVYGDGSVEYPLSSRPRTSSKGS